MKCADRSCWAPVVTELGGARLCHTATATYTFRVTVEGRLDDRRLDPPQ